VWVFGFFSFFASFLAASAGVCVCVLCKRQVEKKKRVKGRRKRSIFRPLCG